MAGTRPDGSLSAQKMAGTCPPIEVLPPVLAILVRVRVRGARVPEEHQTLHAPSSLSRKSLPTNFPPFHTGQNAIESLPCDSHFPFPPPRPAGAKLRDFAREPGSSPRTSSRRTRHLPPLPSGGHHQGPTPIAGKTDRDGHFEAW